MRAGRSAFASRDSRWVTTDETMPTADTVTVIRAPLLRSTGLAFPVVAAPASGTRNCPVAMDHMGGGGTKGKGRNHMTKGSSRTTTEWQGR